MNGSKYLFAGYNLFLNSYFIFLFIKNLANWKNLFLKPLSKFYRILDI